MPKKGHGNEILVALITLIGVLGAALINKWDTIFPKSGSTSTQTQQSGSAAQEQPRLSPGQLNGDWVDTQSLYVWRIKHFHDVIEIEVYTPVGRFHEKGSVG